MQKIFLGIVCGVLLAVGGVWLGANLTNHPALAAVSGSTLNSRTNNNTNVSSTGSLLMSTVYSDPAVSPIGTDNTWPVSTIPNPNDKWRAAFSVLGHGYRPSNSDSKSPLATFADVNGDGLNDIMYTMFEQNSGGYPDRESTIYTYSGEYYLFLNGGAGYDLAYKCIIYGTCEMPWGSTAPCTFQTTYKGDCAASSLK